MQTFGLTLQLNLSAIITKQFLEEARKEGLAAVEAGAPLFLKTMQEKFPDDDDQFMLAIVKNALRTQTRLGLIDFMTKSGVGGRVSPVQIVQESIAQPAGMVGEYIAAQDAKPLDGAAKAVQVDVSKDLGPAYDEALHDNLAAKAGTPGAQVNQLIQERAE